MRKATPRRHKHLDNFFYKKKLPSVMVLAFTGHWGSICILDNSDANKCTVLTNMWDIGLILVDRLHSPLQIYLKLEANHLYEEGEGEILPMLKKKEFDLSI